MSNNNSSSYFPPCVTTAGRTPLYMTASGQLKNWSEVPANSNVNINNYDISNVNILDSTEILTGTITSLNSINGNLTVTNLTDLSGNIKILNEDNQAPNYLQAISGNLFFNNQLLAKANDIQEIADWSLYPALQTINADNHGINNTGNISFGNNTNILSIDGSNQLLYNGVILGATGGVGPTGATGPTGSIGPTGAGGSGADASLWANFPAVNAVNLPDQDFNMTTSTPGIAYNKAVLNADVDFGSLADAPLRPDFNAYCGTITLGGITSPLTNMNINSAGAVNVNSIVGVSLAGGGGVSIAGAGGVSVLGTGVVSVAGGGISVNGAGGVSIVGTGVLSIASGGILVSGGGVSVTAGGMTITAGGLGVLGGTLAIGAVSGAGGGVNVFGSDIQMIPVGPATSSLKTNLIGGYTVGGLAITDVATINGAAYPPPNTVYQGTYYKSVAQNLTSGDTDITFDLTGSWNNVGSYITHTSGTKNFTVGITGLYQLEFNATILLNNGTWSATVGRGIYIDITRPSTAEQNIIGNTSLQAVANYNMQTSATFHLIVGDVINLRINNPYTLGIPTPPQAQGITNTFDLNTFFSWRFIS